MTSIVERQYVKTQQQATRRTLKKTLWWAATLSTLALCGCGGGPHDLPFRRSTAPAPQEDTQQQSTKTQSSNSATTAEPSDRTSETSDHTEEQTTAELEEPAAAAPAVVLGPSTHRTSFSFDYNTPESESPEAPTEDTYHPLPAEDVQPNNSPATTAHAPQEPLFVSTTTSTSAATDITEEHHNTATGDAPEPPQDITAFSNPQQMLEDFYDVQRQQNSETAAAPQKAMQQTPPPSPPQHKQQHAKNQPQELSGPTTPCALSHHRNILYQGSSYQLTKWGQEAYLSEEGSMWALMHFFPSQSKKTFKEVISLQHITFAVREQKIFDEVAIVVRGATAYAEFAGYSLPFADIATDQNAMISGSSASHHATDYGADHAPAIRWSLKSYKACWANFYHRESKTTLGGIPGRAAALILP